VAVRATNFSNVNAGSVVGQIQGGSGIFRYFISTQEVIDHFRALPDHYNFYMNRAFRAGGREFLSRFTQRSLRGRPGIRVIRKARSGTGRAAVFTPSKARGIGIRARLGRISTLTGKRFTASSLSPVPYMHNRGGVILPIKGKYLRVRIRT